MSQHPQEAQHSSSDTTFASGRPADHASSEGSRSSIFAVPTPFRHQSAFVDAQLELTRGRIRFALDQRERRANGHTAPQELPREFGDAELHIARRLAASVDAGVEVPVAWLEDRLALDNDALRLLWVLLAHELDPIARGMLRQLNTETSADPTTDTLRLVAFTPSAYAAASRLLAPNSVLIRTGLIPNAPTPMERHPTIGRRGRLRDDSWRSRMAI